MKIYYFISIYFVLFSFSCYKNYGQSTTHRSSIIVEEAYYYQSDSIFNINLPQHTTTVSKEGSYVPANTKDSLALVKLYKATTGDNWFINSFWLTDYVYKWYGVTLNEQGRVTSLALYENNLSGKLPPEIGYLTELEILRLNDNNLSGTLPPEIGYLTKLKELFLNNNNLTGGIPPEVGNLGSLKFVNLQDNDFVGEIPAEIGNLKNIDYISLSRNHLSSIPHEIGNLKSLKELYLGYNQLSCNIPPEIGNLDSLSLLYLNNNQLTGEIPAEIGNMRSLKILDIGNNYLTGSIPPELGNLSNLTYLILENNQLTGCIPAELGNAKNLFSITFENNYLHGAIPKELNNLKKLEYLVLNGNNFDSLPDFSPLESSLKNVYYANNKFDFGDFERTAGNIGAYNYIYYPQQRTDLYRTDTDTTIVLEVNAEGSKNSYQWVRNGHNIMNETSPFLILNKDDTGLFYCEIKNPDYPKLILRSKLEAIGVEIKQGVLLQDYNALINFYNATGGDNWVRNDNWLSDKPVNEWYGVTVSNNRVVKIKLDSNNLTGNIPTELSGIDALSYLNLAQNRLSGVIPAVIFSFDNLETLDLRENLLSGEILSGVVQLPNLIKLDLSRNKFSGNIPAEIGNLKNLVYLDLNYNLFEGSIPAELGNLKNLVYLNLNYNLFEGSIPAELGDLNNIKDLYLAGNRLTGTVPEELNKLKNLRYLKLNGNQLDSIIDMSDIVLYEMDIRYNKFDFGDIERFGQDFLYGYENQEDTPIYSEQKQDKITLSVYVGGNGNIYKWYKNSTLLEDDTLSTISIDTSAYGIYYCKITNNKYPELEICSDISIIGDYDFTNGVPTNEYNSLVEFYDEMDGNNWHYNTNWKSNMNVNHWYGVKVDNFHITELRLPYNNLKGSLSSKIGNLTNLKVLNISKNELTSLPGSIGNLKQLHYFDASDNLLSDLPGQIGDMSSLVSLNLGNNRLKVLPENLGHITRVEELFLNGNELKDLPKKMSYMSRLKILNLSDNRFESFPDEIMEIKSLEALYFENNNLTKINDSIHQLKELTTIWLSGNKLTYIPHTINEMSPIVSLHLADNMLRELDIRREVIVSDDINLQNNYLDFRSLSEFVLSVYYPQKKVGERQTYYLKQGVSKFISAPNVGATSYAWYKNGEPISGANLQKYYIRHFSDADTGVYYCKLYSNRLYKLVLTTEPIVVKKSFICHITTETNPAEGGVVQGDGEYYYTDTAKLTITPNEGYRFVNWTENGQQVSRDTVYCFPVNGDRNLVANFSAISNVNLLPEEEHTIDVYPNPAVGFVNIKIDDITIGTKTKIDVYLINTLGVKTKLDAVRIANNELRVDISGFKQGVYYLQILTDNKSASVVKIVLHN